MFDCCFVIPSMTGLEYDLLVNGFRDWLKVRVRVDRGIHYF
jgi:hypothetical protein